MPKRDIVDHDPKRPRCGAPDCNQRLWKATEVNRKHYPTQGLTMVTCACPKCRRFTSYAVMDTPIDKPYVRLTTKIVGKDQS